MIAARHLRLTAATKRLTTAAEAVGLARLAKVCATTIASGMAVGQGRATAAGGAGTTAEVRMAIGVVIAGVDTAVASHGEVATATPTEAAAGVATAVTVADADIFSSPHTALPVKPTYFE